MKNFKRRLTSWLLTFCIVLGLLPTLSLPAKAIDISGSSGWKYATFNSWANMSSTPNWTTMSGDGSPFNCYKNGNNVRAPIIWIEYTGSGKVYYDIGASNPNFGVLKDTSMIITAPNASELVIWSGGENIFNLNGNNTFYVGKNVKLEQRHNGSSSIVPQQGGTACRIFIEGKVVHTDSGNALYSHNGQPNLVYMMPDGDYSNSGNMFTSGGGKRIDLKTPTVYKGSGVSFCTISTPSTELPVGQGISLPEIITRKTTFVAGTTVSVSASTQAGYHNPQPASFTADNSGHVITASPIQYTINLDFTGGKNGTKSTTVYYGDTPPKISPPTYEGYTFQGYWTQPNGTGVNYYNNIGNGTRPWTIIGGTTLYAYWQPNSYTVTYSANKPTAASGTVTGTTLSSTHVYDKERALTTNGYSLPGWTFQGWAETPGGGVSYSDGQSVKNLVTIGTKPLYAVWETNKYTLTLDADGGKGGTSTMVTYDSPYSVGLTAPTKIGFVFQGYYTEKNGGGTPYFDQNMVPKKDRWDRLGGTTLYAKWEPLTYSIDLYSEGNFKSTLNNVLYGKLNLPTAEAVGISKANYTFMGWNVYDDQDWSMYIPGREYNVGLTETQGGLANLYAAWRENEKFTISFNPNGGMGEPPASVLYINNDFSIPTRIPTREQHSFLGWSTDSTASVPTWKVEDKIPSVQNNMMLYAIWAQNPKLSYNANGGSFSVYVPDAYPPKGSSYTLIDTQPGREDYSFAGWTTDSGGSGTVYSSGGSFPMPSVDTVLHAKWTPKRYQVTVESSAAFPVSGIDPAGYEKGATVTFTVSGESGYSAYANGVPVANSFQIQTDTTLRILATDSNQYIVTYLPNGGQGGPADSSVYNKSATVTVSFQPLPTRDGYTFMGWAEQATATAPTYTSSGGAKTFAMPAGGKILYAVWKPIPYTVKYDANVTDGSASGTPGAVSATYGQSFVTESSSAFARTGYKIVGWATSADNANTNRYSFLPGGSASNLTITEGDTVTLYAVWEPIRTKITFNANGGTLGMSINHIWVTYGDALTDNLNPPERTGYTLDGWYGNVDIQSNLEFFDGAMRPKISKWNYEVDAVEITAHWTPIKYNVSLVCNDKPVYNINNIVYDAPLTLPKASHLPNLGIPDTHYLAGWTPVMNGSFANYGDGQVFADGGLTGKAGETVKLYAVIKEKEKYAVNYNANGGTGIPIDSNTYMNGAPVTVKFDVSPVRGGYAFAGWATSSTATVPDYVRGSVETFNIGEDHVTLFAVWTPIRYTVQYNANGGTGSVSPTILSYNQAGGKLSNGVGFSLAGHRLAGWATDAQGEVMYGLNAPVWNLTDQNNGIITLFAVWRATPYTVSFLDGDQSCGSINVVYGNPYGVLPAAPDKPGHTFAGWFTDKTGGVRIVGTEPYTTADNSTLYARWTPAAYTVTFDGAGGNASSPSKTVIYGNPYGTLPVANRPNFQFVGWFTLPDGGETVTAESTVTITASQILYAHWTRSDAVMVTVNAENGCDVSGILSAYGPGDTVNFTVTAQSGFDVSQITVTANQQALHPVGGVYSFTIAGNTTVDISGVRVKTNGVHYDANGGGNIVPPGSDNVILGSEVTVQFSPKPTWEGYTFLGWSRTKGAQTPEFTEAGDKTFSMPQSPVTLYAVWEANFYRFEAPDAADGSYKIENVGYAGAAPNAEGKYPHGTTVSFQVNAGSAMVKVYANGKIIDTHSDSFYYVTLTADTSILVSTDGSAQVYTVTLYPNSGTINSGLVTSYLSGVGATLPTDIERPGHRFDGWYSDSGLTTGPVATISTTDTGNKEFWAKWTAKQYDITLTGGANVTLAPVTGFNSPVNYGGDFSFTVTVADGYSGERMNVTAGGAVLSYDKKDGQVYTYTLRNIQQQMVVMVGGVIDSIHTVTYQNGGQLYSTAMVNHGGTLLEPSSPEKYGYTFTGWYAGNNKWTFGKSGTAVNTDVTLTAMWEINRYAVTTSAGTHVVDFLTQPDKNNTYAHGTAVNFTLTPQTGVSLSDLTVYANGVALQNHGNPNLGSFTFNITADTEISVAANTANRFNVALLVGEGTINSGQLVTYTEGVGAYLPVDVTRPGFTFDGWYEFQDYSGGRVTAIGSDATGEKTYYAKWMKKEYIVRPLQSPLGSIQLNPELTGGKYPYGTIITFTLTPALGYKVDDMLTLANAIPQTPDANKLRTVPTSYTFSYTVTEDTTLYLLPTSASSPTYSAWVNNYAHIYNGTAQKLSVTVVPADLTSMTYQWYKDGKPIPGATDAAYWVKNVADSGIYHCQIQGVDPRTGMRSVTSSKATVSITPAPLSISAQWTITYGNRYGNNAPIVYDGLLGGDTNAVVSATQGLRTSCTYAQYDPAGSYPIVLTGVENLRADNYSISQGTSALTVKPLIVMLRWSGSKFDYDGQVKTVTATVTNAVNNDVVTVTDYVSDLGHRITNSAINIGLYVAQAQSLSNPSYTLIGSADTYNWGIGPVDVPPNPNPDDPNKPDPDPDPNPGGGGGGGGGAVAPSENAVVIVDGTKYDFGQVTAEQDNTVVTVDSKLLAEKIAGAPKGASVEVIVSGETATLSARLDLQNLKTMAAQDMTLFIHAGDITFSLPADTLYFDEIVRAIGGDISADALLQFSVKVLDDNGISAHVLTNGGKLMAPAVDFQLIAMGGGIQAAVTRFSGYTTRTVKLTSEQSKQVTTAVCLEEDGLRHVPTVVYQHGGQWYANIHTLTNSAYALIVHETHFTDTSGKWYGQAVNDMGRRMVISGLSDGRFAGERSITRAEFAAIIVRALGLPAVEGAVFSDVPANAWYCGAVNAAHSYGIVQGKGSDIFAPSASITRQEAMTMLQRAASLAGFTGQYGSLERFGDAGAVDDWALDAVRFNVGSGLIAGNNGQLRPQDNISRAETAVVIQRLLVAAGLIDSNR